jgi:hypothetical protein
MEDCIGRGCNSSSESGVQPDTAAGLNGVIGCVGVHVHDRSNLTHVRCALGAATSGPEVLSLHALLPVVGLGWRCLDPRQRGTALRCLSHVGEGGGLPGPYVALLLKSDPNQRSSDLDHPSTAPIGVPIATMAARMAPQSVSVSRSSQSTTQSLRRKSRSFGNSCAPLSEAAPSATSHSDSGTAKKQGVAPRKSPAQLDRIALCKSAHLIRIKYAAL